MINFKKISLLLAIFFVIGCSIAAISATDVNDNIAIEENTNHDNLEIVSTATNFTDLQKDIENNAEITLNNTVTRQTGENDLRINKTITIDGNGYTIDANNNGRIFNVTSSGSLTLKNITLTNGKINTYGGAIYVNTGNLIITNSSFTSNNANRFDGAKSYGGAIYTYNSNLNITNSNFMSNNVANGGAIYAKGSNFTITGSNFTDNHATTDGGAINIGGYSHLNITDSNFNSNNATKYGGAIYTFDFTKSTIIDSSFTDNNAFDGGAIYAIDSNSTIIDSSFTDNNVANGGAIYAKGSNFTITGSNFTDNHATTDGGAINIGGYSHLNITDSNFNSNNAKSMGGAIHTFVFAKSTIIDSSFTDNNANCGGAISTYKSNLTITNSSFTSNNATKYGGAISNSYSNCNVTNSNFNNNRNENIYNYNSNCTTTNCNITTLNLQSITKYYNDSTKLVATLTNDNIGIANERITFIINGCEYNRTTDSNGQAFLGINLSPGVYPVSAIYNNTFIANDTVTILSTVESSDLVKFYKNSTKYSAKFLDSKGNGLSNKEVQFNIHGVFYTKTTDMYGVASLAINLDSGFYIITAINPVTGEQKGNNITVLSSISSKDITLYYKNGTKYEAIFYKSEGIPLTNTKINLNINGVLYEKTTDSNGIATLSINLDPKDYIITAINPVNGEMIGSNVKILPVLVGSDMDFTYGEARHYTVKSLDGQGKPLANQTIKMNINGVFYEKTTDSNGEANLNIRLDPGEYIITSYWNTAITSNTIKIRS